MIEINYVAVLVAAVVAFVVGFVWYNPKVFGTMWMRLAKVNPDSAEAKKMMTQSIVMGFVTTAISAYVLAHFVAVWGAADFIDAVQLGFWVWLGFVATVLLGGVLWEKKPIAVYIINAGHYLVTLLIMGAILAIWT